MSRKFYRFLLFLVVLPLFGGCSTTNNFRAYYNTFYNARRAYDSGYKAVEKEDEPVDMDVFLPLFVRPAGSAGSRDFESAIVKSADVLRNHGDTKWVDDALFLIGKSYFYQENIVGALEKFREVIERKSDLENEARFWLARTLITSRAFDDAQTTLTQSINRDGVPKQWLAMYNLALAELYIRQSLWEDAADALSSGLEDSKDKESGARAQFLLGQVYEKLERWEDAFKAYSDVRKKGPLYELLFASKLSSARLDAFYIDIERGLKSLKKLEGDDKYYSYEPLVQLVRARALQHAGRGEEAYSLYTNLLYGDRDTPIAPVIRGRVHYSLAHFYQEFDQDFIRASAHFDSAATSISIPKSAGTSRSTEKTQFSAEAITDAAEMRESFSDYARIYAKAERLDSLLWLGSLDQESFDAKIYEYRVELGKRVAEQRRQREQRQLEQQFRQSSETSSLYADRRLPEGKIISDQSTAARERAGFLSHRDPGQIEEGKANFEIRWGDRPLVSNWRRISAVIVRTPEQLQAEAILDSVGDSAEENVLPEIDTSAVPRDSLSQAKLRSERSVIRYDLGNSLFLAMDRPDSAAVLYRLVIEENSEEKVAQRAFYALAEVQRALGDTTSANRLYDEILTNYPDSDFSTRILRQRGLLDESLVIDSVAVAESAYRDAYLNWQNGGSQDVVDDMLSVAAAHPRIHVRAMALLAVGTVHFESAGTDSLAVLEPIYTTLPDSILARIWPEKFNNASDSGDGFEPSELMEADNGDRPDSSATILRDSLDVVDSRGISSPTDSLRQTELSGKELTETDPGPASADSTLIGEVDSGFADIAGQTMPDSSVIRNMKDLSVPTAADSSAQPLDVSSATEVLPGTATVLSPERPIDTEAATDAETEANNDAETEAETNVSQIYVEDVFKTIIAEFSGSDYARRAQALLSVVNGVRIASNAPVSPAVQTDTTSLLLAANSTVSLDSPTTAGVAVPPDALATADVASPPDALAVADVAVSPDALATADVAVSPDALAAAGVAVSPLDSLATADVAVSPDALAAAGVAVSPQDSLVASDSTNYFGWQPESLPDKTQDVIAFDEPGYVPPTPPTPATGLDAAGVAAAGEQAIPPDIVRFPSYDLTGEDLGGEEYFESDNVKPLLVNDQPDLLASGWTVFLDWANDLTEAKMAQTRYSAALDSTGIQVLILSEVYVPNSRLRLSWGLFPSRSAAGEAAKENASRLPDNYSFIRLSPATW